MVNCTHCRLRKKCFLVNREEYDKVAHIESSVSRPQLCLNCIKALHISLSPEQLKNVPPFLRKSISIYDTKKNHPSTSPLSSSSTITELSYNSQSPDPLVSRPSTPSQHSKGNVPFADPQSPLSSPSMASVTDPPAGDRGEECAVVQRNKQPNPAGSDALQQMDPGSEITSENHSQEILDQASKTSNPTLILIPLLFSEIKNIFLLPVTMVDSQSSEKICITIEAVKDEKGYKVLSSSCLFITTQVVLPPNLSLPQWNSTIIRDLPSDPSISRMSENTLVNSAQFNSPVHSSESSSILQVDKNNDSLQSDPFYQKGLIANQADLGNTSRHNNSSSELNSTISTELQTLPSLNQVSVGISACEISALNISILTHQTALSPRFPVADLQSFQRTEPASIFSPVASHEAPSNPTISRTLHLPSNGPTPQQYSHCLSDFQSLEPELQYDVDQAPIASETEFEAGPPSQNRLSTTSKVGGCKLSLRDVIRLPYDDPAFFAFESTEIPIERSSISLSQRQTSISTQTQLPFSPKKVRFIQLFETSEKSTQTDLVEKQEQPAFVKKSTIKTPQIIRLSQSPRYIRYLLRPIQKNRYSQTPRSLAKSLSSTSSNKDPKPDSETLLSKFNFGPDQLHALKNPSGYARWQPTTIFSALQLRLLTSSQAYNFIRTILHYPLPSIRTLQTKMQNFAFTPGFQKEVVETISLSLAKSDVLHRDCSLTYDEMEIKAALNFCPSLKRVLGIPTLKSSKPDDIATHLFVVMARGLHSAWKSIVGWHFTSAPTLRDELSNFILQTISSLEASGLHVMAIASDTGGNNLKIMADLGIFCKLLRNTRIEQRSFESPFDLPNIRIQYSIPNPADENRKIYFIPDPPHVLKNIRNQLQKQDFFIPPEILKEWGFTSNAEFVSFDYIRKLYGLQRDNKFRMAFKLSASHINPDSYSKMRVGLAFDIFSRPVQAGIKSLIETNSETQHAAATVKFLSIVEKWFSLSTSRHTSHALHKNNEKTKQSFEELKSTMKVFANMVAVDQGSHAKGWKPIQSALLIATHSLLSLTKDLFERGYEYVMTGRFSQDPLESLFGVIRSRTGPHPTAPQSRNALKTICAANLTKPANNNLTPDENPLFRPRKKTGVIVPNQVYTSESAASQSALIPLKLSQVEELAFYDFCGAVTRKVLNNSIIGAIIGEDSSLNLCADCTAILDIHHATEKSSIFTQNLSRGHRLTVNEEVFSLLSKAERVVRMQMPSLISDPCILEHLQEKIIYEVTTTSLDTCCQLREKLLKVFVRYSLSVELSFLNKGIISHQHAALNFSEIPDADCPFAHAAERTLTESGPAKIPLIVIHPLALQNLTNDTLPKQPAQTVSVLLPSQVDRHFLPKENQWNGVFDNASRLPEIENLPSSDTVGPLSEKIHSSDAVRASSATIHSTVPLKRSSEKIHSTDSVSTSGEKIPRKKAKLQP